jgi:chemotaxis protein histidine kinase CheA
MELIDFCYDILILILEEVDPADLAAVSQTSRAFHTFIKGNQRLFKAHYLQKLVRNLESDI